MTPRTGSNQFALRTFDAMEAYLRASGHADAADKLGRARRELEHHFGDPDSAPERPTELPAQASTSTPIPVRKLPRRDRDPSYRLHVESIEYFLDEAEFLTFRTSQKRD